MEDQETDLPVTLINIAIWVLFGVLIWGSLALLVISIMMFLGEV